MPTAVERAVHSLRVQSLGHDAAAHPDRRLLEEFAGDGDQSAFAELVRRHGPLVLGVCRRILGNVQDAEDAFQATFLVLARKAGAVRWRDSIKNWLHGVACRVAMKARSRAIQRKQKEQEAGAKPVAVDAPAAAWHELRAVLDAELAQLPDKYRAVLLLCYLEGKTRDEAAEALGWSVGAVKGCLERGREMLRGRLAKRGLTLSAALITGLLSETMAGAASVPTALTAATVQSASAFLAGSAAHSALAPSVLSLAQGALNAMLLAKIKTMGLVAMMLMLGTGALVGVHFASAERHDMVAGFPVSPVQGREPQNEQRKDEPFGLVKAIDLKVGTLTITPLRDGGGDDQTFSLAAKNLQVSTSFGEPIKLADVTVGMRVHLQLQGLDVTALRVENPVVAAFLTSISDEKRTVQARAERQISMYSVAKDARITINGKPAKLAEVPIDERIFLTLSIDKRTILAIHNVKGARRDEPPGGERPKGDRPAERPVERVPTTSATIIDVDADKESISLLVGRDGDLKIKTVTLAKDSKIKVLFDERAAQEITLAQLTKPLTAIVQLSDDDKSAKALTVLAPLTRGSVKAVDAAGKKITLTVEGREDKTYDVDAAAVIRVQGRGDGKLADVTQGMSVLVGLSLDRQRVIGITAAPTRRDGGR